MTASDELICFPVWPLPETAMGLLGNCLMDALPQTLHDLIIPLMRSKGSPWQHPGQSPTYILHEDKI